MTCPNAFDTWVNDILQISNNIYIKHILHMDLTDSPRSEFDMCLYEFQ